MERRQRRGMVKWTRGKKRARLFNKESEEEDEYSGAAYLSLKMIR